MASGKEGPGRADGGCLVFVVSIVFVEERRSGGGRGGDVGVVGGHFGGAVARSHAGPAALDERSRRRRCGTSQDTHLPLHKVIFETGKVDLNLMMKSIINLGSTFQGVFGHRRKEMSQDCVAEHMQECVRSLYIGTKP